MKKILAFLMLFFTGQPLAAIPKAIIFDFGGVLNLEENHEALDLFIQNSFLLSPTVWATANQERKYWSKAGMTEEEFWNYYSYRKNITLPQKWTITLEPLLKAAVGADPDMYRLVEELKNKGLRVGLLSNVNKGRVKMLRAFGFYAPFDPLILSSEVGLEKPDPQIYLLLLETLALPARDVVFVDDKPSNIAAARKLGIDGIIFESEAQLRHELSKRL